MIPTEEAIIDDLLAGKITKQEALRQLRELMSSMGGE